MIPPSSRIGTACFDVSRRVPISSDDIMFDRHFVVTELAMKQASCALW